MEIVDYPLRDRQPRDDQVAARTPRGAARLLNRLTVGPRPGVEPGRGPSLLGAQASRTHVRVT